MSKETHEFSGTLAYVSRYGRRFEEDKPMVWSVRLYPETAADRAAIRATGTKNKAQEDDGKKSGVEGWYFTFRSNEEYPIVDAEGKVVEKLVASGSKGRVVIEVEPFMTQKYGQTARTTLKTVVIDDLIEYKRPEETDTPTKAPPAE